MCTRLAQTAAAQPSAPTAGRAKWAMKLPLGRKGLPPPLYREPAQVACTSSMTGVAVDGKTANDGVQGADDIVVHVAMVPLEAAVSAVAETTDTDTTTAAKMAAFGAVADVYPPLDRPVVVPRVHWRYGTPFARMWAPALAETHGIDRATFLAFVDGLSLVMSPHPAALLLTVAAVVLSIVPGSGYSDLASALLQMAAEVTTFVVAHRRMKRYLSRANELLFHPRGLHATVANRTSRMRRKLQIPDDTSLLPPVDPATVDLTVLERCLHHFDNEGWAAAMRMAPLPSHHRIMPMAWPRPRPLAQKRDDPAGNKVNTETHDTDHAGAINETVLPFLLPPSFVSAATQMATKGEAASSDPATESARTPPSVAVRVSCAVHHGLAVVADKRVRYEINQAEKEGRQARKRQLKRIAKGKASKVPYGEKSLIRQLAWIVIRSKADVDAEKAAKAEGKKAKHADVEDERGGRHTGVMDKTDVRTAST